MVLVSVAPDPGSATEVQPNHMPGSLTQVTRLPASTRYGAAGPSLRGAVARAMIARAHDWPTQMAWIGGLSPRPARPSRSTRAEGAFRPGSELAGADPWFARARLGQPAADEVADGDGSCVSPALLSGEAVAT